MAETCDYPRIASTDESGCLERGAPGGHGRVVCGAARRPCALRAYLPRDHGGGGREPLGERLHHPPPSWRDGGRTGAPPLPATHDARRPNPTGLIPRPECAILVGESVQFLLVLTGGVAGCRSRLDTALGFDAGQTGRIVHFHAKTRRLHLLHPLMAARARRGLLQHESRPVRFRCARRCCGTDRVARRRGAACHESYQQRGR